MNDRYFALVSLGPGKKELLRVKDLLDSIACYQSAHCAGAIVIDDGGHGSNIVRTVDFPSEVIVIKNPRERHGWGWEGALATGTRGWGWEGGLATGILAGFRYALDHDVNYVLKLDTDSLVIAPFHRPIMESFEKNKSVGMIGYLLQPGVRRGFPPGIAEEAYRKTLKLLSPVSVWRKPHWHLRFSWTPNNRKAQRYFQLAWKNGYRTGEVLLGGGYAIGLESLRRFERTGVFDDPFWLLYGLVEDLMFSMLVKSCDLDLLDLGGPGEVFGMELRGLRDTPERLADDGCSIIHSLKDHGVWREDQTRGFFRNRRRGVPPCVG